MSVSVCDTFGCRLITKTILKDKRCLVWCGTKCETRGIIVPWFDEKHISVNSLFPSRVYINMLVCQGLWQHVKKGVCNSLCLLDWDIVGLILWILVLHMVRCDPEPAGRPQTHHVSQVVHPQLVGVHAQRRLLVVGINHPHVLLPDGSANLFLALRQKKKKKCHIESKTVRIQFFSPDTDGLPPSFLPSLNFLFPSFCH